MSISMTIVDISSKKTLFSGSIQQCMWWIDIHGYKLIEEDSYAYWVK